MWRQGVHPHPLSKGVLLVGEVEFQLCCDLVRPIRSKGKLRVGEMDTEAPDVGSKRSGWLLGEEAQG